MLERLLVDGPVKQSSNLPATSPDSEIYKFGTCHHGNRGQICFEKREKWEESMGFIISNIITLNV